MFIKKIPKPDYIKHEFTSHTHTLKLYNLSKTQMIHYNLLIFLSQIRFDVIRAWEVV